MALNSFLKIFMPKNKVFYELFEKVANNAAKMGSLLRDIVAESEFDKRATLITQVEDLEHANDELTHNIFTELGRNFITHSTGRIFIISPHHWMILPIIFMQPLKR